MDGEKLFRKPAGMLCFDAMLMITLNFRSPSAQKVGGGSLENSASDSERKPVQSACLRLVKDLAVRRQGEELSGLCVGGADRRGGKVG